MRLTDFQYDLPAELIAQSPARRREGSRMLVVDRAAQKFADRLFADLPGMLRADDLLVLNNTKVFPARLFGRSESGASIEIFLVSETGANEWQTLARPARRLRPGKRIVFSERLAATVLEKFEDGKIGLRFIPDGDLADLIDELGRTPLPPYIKRARDAIDEDRERYQTVYAKNRGAIAAPTAGLHFTPEIIAAIEKKGVSIAEVTLHVGYGTFEPVRVDDLNNHQVMPEQYEISENAADRLNTAKTQGRRIVAVGTTTTRALESNLAEFGRFTPGKYSAAVTITPGHAFRAVDGLLTNFHLPQSSLLILTSTFGGHELIMSAYRHAVAERYRFYSYGDCMLVI